MNIGIAGMGRMGRFHLERLAMTQFDGQIIAYYDPYVEDQIQVGSHRLNPIDEWQDFVNHPELEIILLCSPTEFHFEQLSELLEAGKKVLSEHPICLTPEQASRIDSLEDSLKENLFLLPNQFHHPDFLYAREAVRKNLLGKVHLAKILSRGADMIDEVKKPLKLFEMMALYLDQFLQLVPESPDSLYASSKSPDQGKFPTDDLVVLFSGNHQRVGEIEISTSGLIPVEAEWLVEGNEGGYFQEKIFTRTEEEEIFHQPVSGLVKELPEESLEQILQRINSSNEGKPDWDRGLEVVRILGAIGESLKTGQSVLTEKDTEF